MLKYPIKGKVMAFRIRKMDWPDIEQVIAIDRQCFPTMLPPTSYKTEMINPMAHYFVIFDDSATENNEAPGIVIPEILGFAGLWMMAGESHIINLAVRPTHRRMGLGESLLARIVEASIDLNARLITLEVRLSNTAARALYAKHGFVECGRRKAYYLDNREDAVIMTLSRPGDAIRPQKMENVKPQVL